MTTIELTEAEELAQEAAALGQHQAAIDAIHARQAERQRTRDIALLEKARNELAERTAFYQKNLPVYREQSQNYGNAQAHVRSAREAAEEARQHMPAVAPFLPNDPDVVAWRKFHDALLARLAEAQAEFDRLPNPEPLRQQLSEAGQQITQLTYTCDNLTRKLEGFSGKSWLEGGSGVSNVR